MEMNMTLTNITELAKNTTIIIVATQPPYNNYLIREYGYDGYVAISVILIIMVPICFFPFLCIICLTLDWLKRCLKRPVIVVDDDIENQTQPQTQPQPQTETEIEITYCGGNDYTLK
jgi:hypothetical protein